MYIVVLRNYQITVLPYCFLSLLSLIIGKASNMRPMTLPMVVLTMVCAGLLFASPVLADTAEELRQRIENLEKELEQARKELAEVEPPKEEVKEVVAEVAEGKKRELKIGGTIGVSYAYGSYHQRPAYADSGPLINGDRRGRNVGGVLLDTFRQNVDFTYDDWSGSFEYRWWWYLKNAGYSSLSRAWLGYDFGENGTLKAGIVRVPFGPGPYGVSSSWFYDQHFYVGLADDRDTGLRWTNTFGKLTLDLGYYLQAQPNGEGGTTRDAIRYDYDVVKWDTRVSPDGTADFPGWPLPEGTSVPSMPRTPGYYDDPKFNRAPIPCDCGFQEKHQFNVRGIYATDNFGEFGASFQYGLLEGTNITPNISGDDEDGTHVAVSAHAKNSFSDFTLYSQLTYYEYDLPDQVPWGNKDLIPMGGYDWAWLTASRAWVPAFNIRYTGLDPKTIWPSLLDGIRPDSIMPYVEWSSIMKLAKVPMSSSVNAGQAFNDNQLLIVGAAIARGGWYILADYAFSNGNLFVGNDYGSGNFVNIYDTGGGNGASGRDAWQNRLNINFRYYF